MSDTSIIPKDSWVPVTPGITSDLTNRSPELYIACCKQFDVENNPRYAMGHQGHGETYCNIFQWDCSVAMRAVIPHWISPEPMGRPEPMGMGKETDANGACEWIKNHGKDFGWYPVDADTAVANANAGKPTVMMWENPGGVGHVAVVLPTPAGSPPHIAQAGLNNYFDVDYHKGFGSYSVIYYAHE